MKEINLVEEVQKAFDPFIKQMEFKVEHYLSMSKDFDSEYFTTLYEGKATGIQEMIRQLKEELNLS